MRPIPALLLLCFCSSAASLPIIVDTDAGTDDLLALCFLLSRPDVEIEAITVVSGVAHVHPGARNVLRLLQAAGKPRIPVYEGPDSTPPGGDAFPDAWRLPADELPSVKLPPTQLKPSPEPAAVFLARRLHDASHPAAILALGPLTNIAAALDAYPAAIHAINDMVVMGGAVRVAGNLRDAGTRYADMPYAEWNLFADPLAAKRVFDSGARFRLIPLDATNKVPIDLAFLRQFEAAARTPLGKAAFQILESSRSLIEARIFFAWDPLAAVALVEPRVVKISSVALSLDAAGKDRGRTREASDGTGGSRVALDADAALFRKTFLAAFLPSRAR